LTASIPLPLVEQRLLSTISEVTSCANASSAKPERLRLDPERRLAVSQGLEVALTRTEFLLLDVLYERRPREVGLMDVLQTVWGFTEGRGTSELVRSHVRNLRLKLAKIGLPDAVQSRRGRGYALTA
jgi:DNA-binding response OmpR family regulator